MKQRNNEIEKMRLAAFNTAMGAMQRLNDLFDACVQARISQDIHTWYLQLINLNIEIDSKMTPEQRKDISQSLAEVHDPVQEHLQIVKANYGEMPGIPAKLWSDLEEIEKKLRRIADEKGLMNPNKITVLDQLFEEDSD